MRSRLCGVQSEPDLVCHVTVPLRDKPGPWGKGKRRPGRIAESRDKMSNKPTASRCRRLAKPQVIPASRRRCSRPRFLFGKKLFTDCSLSCVWVNYRRDEQGLNLDSGRTEFFCGLHPGVLDSTGESRRTSFSDLQDSGERRTFWRTTGALRRTAGPHH